MLLLILFAPLVAVALILFGAPARLTAIVACAIELIGTLFLFLNFDRNATGYQFVTAWNINATMGWRFALGADGLSLLMLLLTAIVSFSAIWFTAEISKNEGAFYSCLLLISAGAVGAFASIDLFFFYAFHELALIPTFLLIGIWGSGNRQTAAWKITIYLALGSFILLLGLILLYRSLPEASRSFDFGVLQTAAAGQISVDAQRQIYLPLLIGFGILISLFPFHTWAPEAYASAPAPAAMLHAGVLKNLDCTDCCDWRFRCYRPVRNIGANSSSCSCSATSSMSGSSRSRKSASTGCSVIPASCTWVIFFSVSRAQICSASTARPFSCSRTDFPSRCFSESPANYGDAPAHSYSKISADSRRSCRLRLLFSAWPRSLRSDCQALLILPERF